MTEQSISQKLIKMAWRLADNNCVRNELSFKQLAQEVEANSLAYEMVAKKQEKMFNERELLWQELDELQHGNKYLSIRAADTYEYREKIQELRRKLGLNEP